MTCTGIFQNLPESFISHDSQATMSVSSGDVLDTFASHSFTFQAPVDFTTVASKKKSRASKKRKALTAALSTDISDSENANTNANTNANANANANAKATATANVNAKANATANSSQNTVQNAAYYLQLAADNLMLALKKETDQAAQIKIQFLLSKTQHILLNTADFESDSQIDLQHQIQAVKSDIECKFKEIQNMIANLQFINPPATNAYIIAEAATAATNSSVENSGKNSSHIAESQTYAQAAASAKANEKSGSSQNKAEERRNLSARSKSVSKQAGLNTAAINSKLNSNSFSYRERRLILLNSKNSALSAADSMKIRDAINKDFQNQLKISAVKPVIAAIVKSYRQQNIVLTTMSNYNADFLIQHENIWKKHFKYQAFLKDKAWYKVVAHGISTEIFNYDKGLDLLKEEIKIFNGIQPLAVNWISSISNRENKKHASIVISFDNEAEAQKALKNKLIIAGRPVKTAIFEANQATEQCLKCQKFGHSTASCKNLAACQFCAENHPTRLHVCKTCEITGDVCIHTNIKCVNCGQKHTANSKECGVLIATFAAKKLAAAETANANANANSAAVVMETSE